MENLPAPHNNFFCFALSDTANARSLLESQLAKSALDLLDLKSVRLEQGSFIDAKLRARQSDLLFSVRRKQVGETAVSRDDRETSPGVAGAQAETEANESLVYLLFEHKSHVDRHTAFQLISYLVRICEQRLREGLGLSPIIPIVVYHGESAWTAARSFKELLNVPAALADYQLDFRYVLLDLQRLPDAEIPGNPVLRSALRLLKYGQTRQLLGRLEELLADFAASLPPRCFSDWLQAIQVYVLSVSNMDSEQYKQTLKSILPTKYVVGSIADQLLTQGHEQGLARGREEGRLAGKIQLLHEMLGEQPPDDSELQQHGLEALKLMLEKLQQRLQER